MKKHKKDPVKLEINETHLKFPWNIKDSTISEIVCTGWLERVPGIDRPKFMDEAYRVLVDNGKMFVLAAYWASVQAITDYRSQWPPLADNSFVFFNKGWRVQNNFKEIMKCDFDFTSGYTVDATSVGSRTQEVRDRMIKHDLNVIQALQVTMTKRPKE